MLFFICGAIGAALLALTATSAVSAIVRGVLGFIVWGILGYFGTPTLGFNFVFLPFMVLACGIIGIIASAMQYDSRPSLGGIGLTLVGVVWLFIIPIFTTWSAFHANEYHEIIGEVQESRFADDVSPVDITQVRTVNERLARSVADKRIGALGSRVDLGQMNIQVVNGCFTAVDGDTQERLCFDNELVWVAPLVHSGVFKQWTHGSTPGYLIVSATDINRVHLVTGLVQTSDSATATNPRMGGAAEGTTSVSNLELRYFYSGGYFGYNAVRHLRENGYLTQGITDYSFEIRDDGRPFWVVTTYDKQVGFSGADATGVVTVDVQTGAIQEYTIEEAPMWIDRIQPESFVQSQLNDWGAFVHGWWNPGNTDKTQTTPGMSLVFGADGQSYWYSGIQSVGADQGTIGFVLVNTRSKETRLYTLRGATETAAESAAQGHERAVRASLTAGNAILYNVNGVPSYFVTLHAANGLPQMYAFIKVEDYNIVGIGTTPQEALRDYQIELNANRSVNVDDLVERESFEGIVSAITTERSGETTFYYLMLEGQEGREYYAGPAVSLELKWTQVGDTVELVIDDGENRSVNILQFDNQRVGLDD